MIPKVIHYCWFGRGKKSDVIESCLASWKAHLPDYEIIEWNEDNTDLRAPYAQAAYADRKWAFVADYVRFKVLWEQGGIYLDTDMLLLQSLAPFLKHTLFFGCERPTVVSMGIVGCEKGNSFIETCKKQYETIAYQEQQPFIITRFVTHQLKAKGFERCTTVLRLQDAITLYPMCYFYPFPFPPYGDYKAYLRPESVGVHLWEGSWLSEWELFEIGATKAAFQQMLQQISSQSLSSGYLLKALRYTLLSPFWAIKSWLRRLLKPEFKI